MTKKKAIEAALRFAWREAESPFESATINELTADHAYELGRIAGRAQAISQLPDAGLIRAWDRKRKLRQWARELAKKARAK